MRPLTTKDSGLSVLFLDAFTVVPGIGPDSDMDGHDLSSLTYSETLACEEWCEKFNAHYLDKATKTTFMGMPIVLVKEFYSDKVFGGEEDEEEKFDDIPLEDRKKGFEAIVDSWAIFNMSPAEEDFYMELLKKKLKIE